MEHGMMPLDEHGLHADVDYMQHPDNGDDQGRVNARPTAMANPLELLCDVAAPSGSYVTSKGMGGMQLDYGDKSGGLAIPESAVIAYPMYGEPDVPPGTKMVLLPCEATPYGWKCLEVAIPADVSLTVKSPVRMWKVLPADQPEVTTHGMHMQAQVGVPTSLASPGNALLTLAAIAQSPLSGGPPNKKQKTAKNAEPKPPRKLNDEERIIVEEMYQIWGGPRQGIKDGIQVQHLSEKVINWLDVCDARNISLKQAQELSEGYKAGFDKNDPAVPQYVFNSGTFNTTFARVLYARVSRLPESFKVHDYITERDTIGKWMDSKKWNIKDAVDQHIKEQNNSAFEKFWREAGKRRLRILAECLNFDQLRTRVEQEFGI